MPGLVKRPASKPHERGHYEPPHGAGPLSEFRIPTSEFVTFPLPNSPAPPKPSSNSAGVSPGHGTLRNRDNEQVAPSPFANHESRPDPNGPFRETSVEILFMATVVSTICCGYPNRTLPCSVYGHGKKAAASNANGRGRESGLRRSQKSIGLMVFEIDERSHQFSE